MRVYKKLFSYLPTKKYYAWLAVLFSSCSVFLTVIGYYAIYQFLRALLLIKSDQLAQSYAMATAILLTAGALFYIFSGLFSHILGFRLETNLRKKGIEGLTQASFRFFDLHSSGAIRKTIDDNAAKTHQSIAHLIPDSAQAIGIPICAIVLGFFISIKLGAALLLWLFIGVYLLKKMMGNTAFIQHYQESLATLSAETVEYVRGIQVVKIFGANVLSFKALNQAITNYANYAYRYSLSCKTPFVLFQWVFFIGVVLLGFPFFFLINPIPTPELLAVDLLMFLFLSGTMFVSFMRVMHVNMYLFEANYAVETLETLYLDMQQDELVYGNETTLHHVAIEFSDVTFSYKEEPILKDFNLFLEEKKSYALVGSSGSGKSTLAKLISGFYKVDKGQLKIGDKPIHAYTKETLTQAISFVFQQSKLFNQSIYENVLLANPQASREQVMEALKLASCDSILAKLPQREKTVIGSKGVYLSGGETQRIAIARAILKDARLVIMDEASAAIDPDNEYELQKAFQNLMKHKTVIMIAHRLSSIQAVDEILVLSEGKVVERGSHAQLIAKPQIYRQLIETYYAANDWRIHYENSL